MTSETEHYSLTKLGPSEGLHAGTGDFPSADRDRVDALLYAALNHVHDGGDETGTAPLVAPDLTPSTTGGSIPAGSTVRYVYTYTDPVTGQTTASPEASYTTADSVSAPDAPTHTLQSIGGTLEPGQYFYVLTAYQTSSTVETKALNPLSVEIPIGTSTNQVELTLPALPADSTGFNIYRRAPGDTKYLHLDTDAGGTYTDDGSVSPGTRTIPSSNSTNTTTSIDVAIPGATPSIPSGNTWTLYRSYTTSFLNSYLVNQDENTLTYLDIGTGTQSASPPDISLGGISHDKVVLTDGAQVSGLLPDEMVAVDDTATPFTSITGDDLEQVLWSIDVALSSAVSGYHDIIDHGATAGTARTAGLATNGSAPILWRGTVEPTNAVNGDDWLDYS